MHVVPSASAPAIARRLRALVVDDVKSNRKLMGLLVSKLGFSCTFAENGEEAVRAWTEANAKRSGGGAEPPFDAVLMDSVMPVLNGVEATRRLRAEGCTCAIIGVTGNALAEDIAVFLNAGVDAVITKPVKTEALTNVLGFDKAS